MNLEQVLYAMNIGETTDWEFKSAQGGFPNSFWETYSAMCNTDGGTVVFGAKERNGKVEPDGLTVEQINGYQKKLWDDLHNRSKISRNLLSSIHVSVQNVLAKNLLVIQIPRANRSEGPIYLGPNPFGNTYRRCHEGDYRSSDDQVRRMLADASSIPRDQQILRGFTIEDLDPVSINQYKQRFSTSRPDHPWNSLPTQDFLEMLGGWRKDRESGEEGITAAALLMFGKYRSIVDVGAFHSYFVDYREKLDPEFRWNHRIYPDGTWEANLFQFYQRIWPHLSADLKVPFRLEGIQRIDETSVHKALREALVNALIHSDYSAPGGVVIERYRDRFVLDNPGTLLVSFDQLRKGGMSECRNKALQTMFMMIGGGEKAGSGVHRIQSEWKTQHWRAPAFSVEDHPDRVRLVLPMISLIPETTLQSLENRFGQNFRSLRKLEILALATADFEGEVSNVRLQELESEHPAEITQVLQGLCAKGMLVSDNRRRWSCYRISKAPAGKEDSSHLAGNSHHLAGNSHHLAGNSHHLAGNSHHIDEHNISVLNRIASSVANKKKVSSSEMRKVLLDLCKEKSLDAGTLAKLLNRDKGNLRDRYLAPMVEEGILQLQYPESPNRPDQAYTIQKPSDS